MCNVSFSFRKQSREQCRAEFSGSPRDALASLGDPILLSTRTALIDHNTLLFPWSSRKAIPVFPCPSFHCCPLWGILLDSHSIEQTLVFMKKTPVHLDLPACIQTAKGKTLSAGWWCVLPPPSNDGFWPLIPGRQSRSVRVRMNELQYLSPVSLD